MTTRAYNPGDVVTIPFTFTNRVDSKVRPAVVVSTNELHGATVDVMLMALTSEENPGSPIDYSLQDWRRAGLPKATKAKPQIGTFERRLVIKRVGTLVQTDWENVQQSIRQILAV